MFELASKPIIFLLFVLIFFFSISFHEFGHSLFAYWLGDNTAKVMGRLTLNPISHLDPLGSIFFLFSGFVGWAKPVPVNPFRFEKINPKLGMAITSIGGPLFNLLLASLLAIVARVLTFFDFDLSVWGVNILAILYYTITINVLLASFNLIPIPPLDGAKILQGTLFSSFDSLWLAMERYGPFILIGLFLLEDASNGRLQPISWFIGVLQIPFFYIVRLISGTGT